MKTSKTIVAKQHAKFNGNTDKFKNIIKAIEAEQKGYLSDFIKTVNQAEDFNGWQFQDLIPKSKKLTFPLLGLDQKRAYLIQRKEKAIYKRIEELTASVLWVANAGDLISAKISVEWKRSRIWGANPSAEVWATFKNKEGHTCSRYIKTGPVTGCGYDKLSTAVANGLNAINEVLKPLYIQKDKQVNKTNHEIFGYGSGYSITPYLEGGVGVSCYPEIFEKIGFKFQSIASGKSFDVFTIEKL